MRIGHAEYELKQRQQEQLAILRRQDAMIESLLKHNELSVPKPATVKNCKPSPDDARTGALARQESAEFNHHTSRRRSKECAEGPSRAGRRNSRPCADGRNPNSIEEESHDENVVAKGLAGVVCAAGPARAETRQRANGQGKTVKVVEPGAEGKTVRVAEPGAEGSAVQAGPERGGDEEVTIQVGAASQAPAPALPKERPKTLVEQMQAELVEQAVGDA